MYPYLPSSIIPYPTNVKPGQRLGYTLVSYCILVFLFASSMSSGDKIMPNCWRYRLHGNTLLYVYKSVLFESPDPLINLQSLL